MHDPCATGVAYREPPKHGGGCGIWPAYRDRLAGIDPQEKALDELDRRIAARDELLAAEARKLEGA